MLDGKGELDLLAGALVEAVVEDGLDAAVAVGAERHGAPCGGLQAVLAVAVGQAQGCRGRSGTPAGGGVGSEAPFR